MVEIGVCALGIGAHGAEMEQAISKFIKRNQTLEMKPTSMTNLELCNNGSNRRVAIKR
jgi:hypothetical protein